MATSLIRWDRFALFRIIYLLDYAVLPFPSK